MNRPPDSCFLPFEEENRGIDGATLLGNYYKMTAEQYVRHAAFETLIQTQLAAQCAEETVIEIRIIFLSPTDGSRMERGMR